MKPDTKIGYLKGEYLLIQKQYEDFDGRIMIRKGWSATIGLAAIATGFYYSPYLWLFAAGASLTFSVREAIWKIIPHHQSL